MYYTFIKILEYGSLFYIAQGIFPGNYTEYPKSGILNLLHMIMNAYPRTVVLACIYNSHATEIGKKTSQKYDFWSATNFIF